MKPLVLYYSYSGNTKQVAEKIHQEIGGDIARIETVTPYTGDYNTVVNQGKKEVDQRYHPPIQPIGVDISQYDTIVLGSPVWWYTYAPAVASFLEQNSLAGKKVYPFITDGGWIGHTIKDLQQTCPDALVQPEIDIYFRASSMATSQEELSRWIHQIS